MGTRGARACEVALGGLLVAAAAWGQDRNPQLAGAKGLPTEKGLGASVIVANLPPDDAGWPAVKKLAKHRKAAVLRLAGQDVASVRRGLQSAGVEFVVFAVTPTTVDMNFHLDVLELCRDLDADPMPDFEIGYLCARDGVDLAAFVDRIVARDGAPLEAPVMSVAAANPPGDHLQAFDAILHFGHGNPWGVVQGLTGEQVGALALTRHPVVVSGACFTAVLSRSYHPCAYQLIYLAPETIAPEKLLSLNWVHAGVTGYLAALEGDRGEMAMAEWDWFRETAAPLGAVIGHQYRLCWTSLPAGYVFPRYLPGVQKRMSFYDVMLRGAMSRVLIGDPALRPFAKPLDAPAIDEQVSYDAEAKTLTVTGRVTRWQQGRLQNYLPKDWDRFDRRLTLRVALPDGCTGRLGEPTLRLEVDGAPVELTQHHVKHEAWGGRRWVNVQAETRANFGSAGSIGTWVFPVRR